MKRYSGLQFLFGLFVVLSMMFVNPFDVCAMTPISEMEIKTLGEGPWAGQNYARARVQSDGSLSQNYYLPTWRDGTSAGEGYYDSFGTSETIDDVYIFSGESVNNIVICSYDPLLELYIVNNDGTFFLDVLDDAFLVESGSKFFYGVSLCSGVGVAFRTNSVTHFTELTASYNGGSYYDKVMAALPYVGGLYDANGYAVKFKGFQAVQHVSGYSLRDSSPTVVFPVYANLAWDSHTMTKFHFVDNGGVMHSDGSYTFNFDVYNSHYGALYYLYDGYTVDSPIVNNVMSITVPGRDVSFSDFGFGYTNGDGDGLTTCIIYRSSSSDDIGTLPPDDSGNGEGSGSPDYSSALAQIGARLDEVMVAVSEGSQQIVNNITYQTTQITNTITNTVTNMTQQITQGLSDVKQGITDKLQGVQEEISGSIEEANKAQIESDQKLHDEQIKADKENTDQIDNAIEEHGNFIIDGLKGLFIPSDEFFKSYFDDLYEYFADRFGFLSFPIELVIRIADIFLTSEKVDAVLVLPAFEISGYQVWEQYNFNFTEFLETSFPFLITAIQTLTSIGLVMAFVNLCQDKWNEVMRS